MKALKVRGQLVNSMACLGQYVPAQCPATIWTTSPPFCPAASLAKGQLVVWPAYSLEATAQGSGCFFCLLGSQWGLGLGLGSQGFIDIGQRQEVVGDGDPPSFPKAIFTYLIMYLHLCHLK